MAILDHTLPLQVKSIDMMRMLDQGSQLAQFWQTQKTDGELNRLYKETNGDLNKMMEIGKTSPMARFVMPQLQAQQAAQQKAALDQQKIEADIGKTKSESEKLGFESKKVSAETGTITIDNSVKLLENANQALKVAAQTGDANAARLALNNAHKAGTITPELYEQYSQQITSLSTKPGALKQFVQGIVLSSEKDAMKYIQPDQNAMLSSETSIKTTGMNNATSKYVADTGAKTASNRLAFDKTVQEQKEARDNGEFETMQGSDGVTYAVYKSGPNAGKVEPLLLGSSGEPFKSQPKGSNAMTEQQSKDALFGGRMQEAHKILLNLEGEDIKAPVMNSLPYGDKFSNAWPSALGGASAKQQQYVQAQRDFINAVLRKESGAVIADSEFENAQKQYFPQIGDSKDVIAQKARNRELAMNMIISGSGAQGKEQIAKATANSGVKGATVTLNEVKQAAKQANMSTDEMIGILRTQGVQIE